MRTILLTGKHGKNKITLVSSEDYDWLSQHSWCLDNGYAVAKISGKKISMHRLILDLETGDGQVVDHINRCKLDNRRSNLRIVTKRENTLNSSKRSDNGSGYIGVSKSRNRWRAYARNSSGELEHAGMFDTPEEAALAAAAKRLQSGHLLCMPRAISLPEQS